MRSHWFIALSCLCLLTACDRKISHTETYAEREGAFGDEATSSHSYSFESEDPLKDGRALVGERKFDEAIAIFKSVYQHNPDRALQAEALFEWAKAEATMFNPDRDVDSAVARLQLLLEEFPGSSMQFQAEEELRRLGVETE